MNPVDEDRLRQLAERFHDGTSGAERRSMARELLNARRFVERFAERIRSGAFPSEMAAAMVTRWALDLAAEVAAHPQGRCDQWAEADGRGRRCALVEQHHGDHVAFGCKSEPIRWPRAKRSVETFHGNASAKRSEVRGGEETPLPPLPSGQGEEARAENQNQNRNRNRSWEGGESW